MAEEARVTAVSGYVEIEPAAEARNTGLEAYVEINPPAALQNTTLMGYVEVTIIPPSALLTGLLAYAEVQMPYPVPPVTGRRWGPAVQCLGG